MVRKITKKEIDRSIKWTEDMFNEILKKTDRYPEQPYMEYEKKSTIKWIIKFEHRDWDFNKRIYDIIAIIDGTDINYEYEIKNIFVERLFNFMATYIYCDTVNCLFHAMSRIMDDVVMKTNPTYFVECTDDEFKHYFNKKHKTEKEKILLIFQQLIKIKYEDDDDEITELYMKYKDEYLESRISCKKYIDIEYIPMTSYYRRKPAVELWASLKDTGWHGPSLISLVPN